ncbi:hypothetical protein Amal_03981 [Acetobacter malorum]|nr:hypothetical protein Amal_03981 [Acetobacter malorum]
MGEAADEEAKKGRQEDKPVRRATLRRVAAA